MILVSYFGRDPEAEVLGDGGADGHGGQSCSDHEDQDPEEPGQPVVRQSCLCQATWVGYQIKLYFEL